MAAVTGEGITTSDDLYIVSVLLLCVTCQQPIKAWVNSPQWLRVEWISPVGECQGCHNQRRESSDGRS